MKWFWRRNKSVEVPPELQPYYEQPESATSVLRRGLVVLAAVVVLAGIGVAVYFLVSGGPSDGNTPAGQQTATNHGKTTVPKPSPSSSPSAPSKTPNGPSASGQAGSLPSDQNGSNGPSTNGASTQNQGSTGQTVVNTGPGDTVALFAGAVIVGTLSFHMLQRRRASSS